MVRISSTERVKITKELIDKQIRRYEYRLNNAHVQIEHIKKEQPYLKELIASWEAEIFHVNDALASLRDITRFLYK